MYYSNILGIVLVSSIGLYVGALGFREYTKITRILEKVSAWHVLKIAVCFGIAGSLFLFALILFAGVLEENYLWSLPRISSVVFISVILGVLITLGAGYQVYTTVKFRDVLMRKYKDKNTPDDHST